MANTIYTQINLDVGEKNNLKVWAKQYDSNDRFLTATIYNGDSVVSVDADSVVTINARREDDAQNSFVGEVNSDGTINLPITYWMTYVPGTVLCDVSLYLNGRLSSLSFKLKVEESATEPSEIIPDESKDIVTALIEDVEEATSEAESATSSALSASQLATTSAEYANSRAEFAQNSANLCNAATAGAELATQNANSAASSANSAAQRAEDAAEQLDVDLSDIRSAIADNTTDIDTLSDRIDTLSSADVSYGSGTVKDELDKLEDDGTSLGNRVTSAEGNITSLNTRTTSLENHINNLDEDVADCEDDIDLLKGRVTTAESSIGSLSRNKEDVGNKVYQTNTQKNMKYYSVAGTDNAINHAISNLNASNIPYDEDDSIEEAIDGLDYDINTLNSTKQSKVFKTNEIRQNADNDHYPSELAVKTYVDSQGGGTSAMMVTFTITGQDASGNYTGIATETYSAISTALSNNEIVRGQIALGTYNYVSYSTMQSSTTIRFYVASREAIYELVAEYSESGGEETYATFTAYATPIPDLTDIWAVNNFVVVGNNGYNSKFLYKYQTSVFGGGFTMCCQIFTQTSDELYLRDYRTANSVTFHLSDIKTVLDEANIPNQLTTISNKNSLTFEFNVANVLTYDLADNSFKVKTLRFLPPAVGMSNTELLLFGRLNVNTACGLFVDFAHSTGNQSATITIPT